MLNVRALLSPPMLRLQAFWCRGEFWAVKNPFNELNSCHLTLKHEYPWKAQVHRTQQLSYEPSAMTDQASTSGFKEQRGSPCSVSVKQDPVTSGHRRQVRAAGVSWDVHLWSALSGRLLISSLNGASEPEEPSLLTAPPPRSLCEW